jgi:signal transduction histidine kinase
MQDRSTQTLLQEQQEKSLFLFVVVVGYIITLVLASNEGTSYTAPQVLLGISFGAIYLSLIYFEAEILNRFPPNTKSFLFFSIQLLLVLGIGWTLGPGGNWLIGLPLVGVAVEWLSPRSRWYVYVGLIAAIVLPILHYSNWVTAIMNAFVISAAIFFVAALTQSRMNEQEARARAEELTVQLEKVNIRLSDYVSQVEDLAAAQERNRLAREIHDNVGHYLTIVNVQLEAAKAVFPSDPERALDALEKAHDLVRKGLASIRESVSALRVSPVENRSLQDAVRLLIEETRASGMKVELKLLGTPKAVDDKTALALYRSSQEGLTNVRKHANASSVEIELDFSQQGLVRLSIRDNGVGAAEISGGFGLTGISERAHLLGGKVDTQTQPGEGFCLHVTLPLAEEIDP